MGFQPRSIASPERLTLLYEGKKCIHSRFCVTGAPQVFLANIVGPWIHPDAIDAAKLVEIAHVSIRRNRLRKDGGPDEAAPPVNLIAIRENGPYAVHADVKSKRNRPRLNRSHRRDPPIRLQLRS
jgi:uncharacterized Fe-S cluster protein YjdI